MTRLLLVSGKGGVGKSAVAAASALAARRRGEKVLALDMLGSSGLGSHLGEPDLGFEPQPVGEGLDAASIDRAEALLEYLRVQVGVPALATIGPAARAFDALASTAPAIREVVTMGKILWEVRRKVWDVVVVDAAPTGQIGSYLRAARTVRELLATGRILEQVEWMEQILTDPEKTRLVLVTLLEELPAVETAETLRWVTDEELVGEVAVVANRALPRLEAPVPDEGGAVAEAASLHQALWEEQQEWLESVPVDAQLPYLFGTHTPAEVAERLADALEDL